MTVADDFADAYHAWRWASDQHRAMMAKVMAGDMLDTEAMARKVAELNKLHAEWMSLAQDFAKVKAPEGSAV